MNIGKSIGTIVKVAIVCAVFYGVINWQNITSQDDDIRAFAERACIDEIRQRFNPSTVKVYSINENTNGYVVRATATLAKGNTATVYCLTNTHGGVKDVTVEEH